MDRNDPACRRTLARQLWLARDMRREQKHILDRPNGWYRDSASTDIRRTFALYQDVQALDGEQAALRG